MNRTNYMWEALRPPLYFWLFEKMRFIYVSIKQIHLHTILLPSSIRHFQRNLQNISGIRL